VRDVKDLLRARSLEDLSRRHRLVLGYAVGLVSVILVFSGLYNWGMRTLEGDPHSIFRSFQTVVETMTTTGYGADSPWDTPWMNLLVVFMQLTGIAIGFFTLRVLIIPLFKRTPVLLDRRLRPKDDHVIVGEYRRDSDVLLDELERLGIEYVLLDSDVDEAQRLSDAGYQVIDGDAEQVEDLERVGVRDASMLVADAGDRNASIVLTATDLNEDLRSVALTASPRRNRALRQVGVDVTASPHAIIGRRLGHKASSGVTIPEGVSVGEDVEIREILVRRGSPLHGREIRETAFFDHPRLVVVAGWFDGELRLPPAPTDRLTPNTVLVVAGPRAAIDEAREAASGVSALRDHSEVVVVGMGEGGRAAVDALPPDVSTTTIDEHDHEGVDVVGDAGEPETLVEAGVEDATALIVTVDDDASALLAVALTRSLTDEIEILARLTDADKTRAAFSAGADYVLPIQRTTARLLAREIHGEDVLSPVGQLRLVRTGGDHFAGQSIADINREPATGPAVVGIERDGTFRTELTTTVEAGDEVLLAGTDEMMQTFEREAG
jgi:Trk K+ transport system NAD-binding subunit